MKKLLLDTSGYSRLMSGDRAVLEALADADQIFMSVFVLGELYAAFRGGDREKGNRDQLRRFMESSTVRLLQAGDDTAEIFGRLKHQLKLAGTPVPINDLWIAAHAVESGSHLVTFDRHFSMIPGVLL